jgi:hypothetical protein
MKITYSQGYKYLLEKDFMTEVEIHGEYIVSPFIELGPGGHLLIRKGYAWDGPSGPAVDTKDFMRGALVHDALYQLIREHGLDSDYKSTADKIMRHFCLKDGMNPVRAWTTWLGLRLSSKNSVRPESSYRITTAP